MLGTLVDRIPKYSLKFMKFMNVKDAIIVSKRDTENILKSVQRKWNKEHSRECTRERDKQQFINIIFIKQMKQDA